MPDELERELAGVMPESLPADEEVIEEEVIAESDEGESEPEPDGRTIENIHREFDRKFERLEGRLEKLFSQPTQPEPTKPSDKTGNQLDDMPIDQLRKLRTEVPEDRQADFDAYLTQRIVEETVEKRVTALTKEQSRGMARTAANQQAVDRFPELKDKDSEFRAAVQDRLTELGRDYVDGNPRAVLDAANDVAIGMDHRPRMGVRRPVTRPATRGNADVRTKTTEGALSTEKAQEIADRLRRAMPGKEFDLEKIKADHEAYTAAKQLYVRG